MQVSTFQNKYNVSDSTYYRYKFKTEKEFGVKIKVKTYKKHSEIVTEEQEHDILDGMGTIEYMKKYNVCENTFVKHKKYVGNKHPEHQFKNEHTYKPKVDIDLIKDDILNGICKRDFCLKYNLSESCYKKYRRLLLKNNVSTKKTITEEMEKDIRNGISAKDYAKKYNLTKDTFYKHKQAVFSESIKK